MVRGNYFERHERYKSQEQALDLNKISEYPLLGTVFATVVNDKQVMCLPEKKGDYDVKDSGG